MNRNRNTEWQPSAAPRDEFETGIPKTVEFQHHFEHPKQARAITPNLDGLLAPYNALRQ
ncbi:MAG: hypothetical protein ABGY42_16905 [bacterium]